MRWLSTFPTTFIQEKSLNNLNADLGRTDSLKWGYAPEFKGEFRRFKIGSVLPIIGTDRSIFRRLRCE